MAARGSVAFKEKHCGNHDQTTGAAVKASLVVKASVPLQPVLHRRARGGWIVAPTAISLQECYKFGICSTKSDWDVSRVENMRLETSLHTFFRKRPRTRPQHKCYLK